MERLLQLLTRKTGEKDLVLRHLDSKEYVVCSKLQSQYPTLTLTEVIFVNFHHASSLWIAPPHWKKHDSAGHRFDISTLKDV